MQEWVLSEPGRSSARAQLQAGMQIESFDRGALSVQGLVTLERNEITYNFTVGDFHTYFVGGQRALVHNCNRACASLSAVNLARQLTSDEQCEPDTPVLRLVRNPSFTHHFSLRS